MLMLGIVAMGEWADWWDAVDASDYGLRYTDDEIALVLMAVFFGAAFIAWAVEQIVAAIRSRNGVAK